MYLRKQMMMAQHHELINRSNSGVAFSHDWATWASHERSNWFNLWSLIAPTYLIEQDRSMSKIPG